MISGIQSKLLPSDENEFKDITEVKTILENLKKKYVAWRAQFVMSYIQNFYSIKLDNFEGVRTFAEGLQNINGYLKSLSQGVEFSEVQMIARFLDGLPSSYEGFKLTLKMTKKFVTMESDEGVVAFEKVVDSAALVEQLMNQEARLRGGCGHCNKAGHTRKDCWNLRPELGRPAKRRRRAA